MTFFPPPISKYLPHIVDEKKKVDLAGWNNPEKKGSYLKSDPIKSRLIHPEICIKSISVHACSQF